ncbi:class I SAM-dependent methyltransferase [Mycolicibacter kumamotonensis]|uniref:Methyltransferase domain-containing protein n=1 Tax=Mycolicibacter kumamotonensis TaxID=354243 RepID=A0A1B8SL59_9MYCO|nr:class I SAM-dependent methyltransferase [Mycolicibacter kumamotonensis]OBY33475.1 hypothetical protein ACT18_00565 [Mycolicibacter kumamotonensis]
MPGSHPEGRDWVLEHLKQTTAPTIVDLGAGEGTYSMLARDHLPTRHWIAVDIFEPYVERYQLHSKYDEVHVSDLRDYQLPTERFVLLAGDVIEHLPRFEAALFLDRARSLADEIMVSVPIIDYPQGELEGNIHETHLYQWDFDEMAEQLPGCETWKGEVIGRFWWKNRPTV